LYAAADAAVAEAFRRAEEADAAYRASLDALDLARAAAADRRRAEEAATAAGTATSTTAPASTTTTAASATTLAPSTTASAPSTSLAAPTTIPTTTTTTPAAPRPAIKPAVERWRPQVSAAFPADLVEDALVIMQCESGGDPNAVNPYSGAAGLYQFMPGTWAAASVKAGVGDRSVFDGEANIIAAAWLAGYYRSRGYDPWEPWAPCRVHL
jgi:soluble lytic murein transglycosylase-like protein